MLHPNTPWIDEVLKITTKRTRANHAALSNKCYSYLNYLFCHSFYSSGCSPRFLHCNSRVHLGCQVTRCVQLCSTLNIRNDCQNLKIHENPKCELYVQVGLCSKAQLVNLSHQATTHCLAQNVQNLGPCKTVKDFSICLGEVTDSFSMSVCHSGRLPSYTP